MEPGVSPPTLLPLLARLTRNQCENQTASLSKSGIGRTAGPFRPVSRATNNLTRHLAGARLERQECRYGCRVVERRAKLRSAPAGLDLVSHGCGDGIYRPTDIRQGVTEPASMVGRPLPDR